MFHSLYACPELNVKSSILVVRYISDTTQCVTEVVKNAVLQMVSRFNHEMVTKSGGASWQVACSSVCKFGLVFLLRVYACFLSGSDAL